MIIEGSAGSWGVEAEKVWTLIIRSTDSLSGKHIECKQLVSKICSCLKNVQSAHV